MYRAGQRIWIYDSGEEFVGVIKSIPFDDDVIAIVLWGFRKNIRGSLYTARFHLEKKVILGQSRTKKEKRRPITTRLLDEFERTQYAVGLSVRVHLADRVVEGVIEEVSIRGTCGCWLRIIGDNAETIETRPPIISIPRPDLISSQ